MTINNNEKIVILGAGFGALTAIKTLRKQNFSEIGRASCRERV